MLSVDEDSGADRAGLRGTSRLEDGSVELGDLIQSVGDRAVRNTDDLLGALERHRKGDVVSVGLLRAGKTVRLDVKLH